MPALRQAVDHLRRFARPRPNRDTDRALLSAFAASRDEAAFAELVRRHGPLVRGVCRRVLGADPAMDDAFQATFLLLARKAAHGGWQDSIAGWLHAAAWHIAQKARRAAIRRRRHELVVQDNHGANVSRSPDPLAAAAWRELCQVLDEELARLPERLRSPLVLCYLEGRSRDEAAARLGWSLGTLKNRLARARALLQGRLTRRGVTLAIAGLPAAVTGESVSASTAMEVGRLAADYVCGEAVTTSVAVLLRGAIWSGGAKSALIASVVLLVGLFAGVASREREGPGDSPKPMAPIAQAQVMLRDRLPVGAVARLGTLEFCPGDDTAQVLTSVDGKSIITLGYRAVRIWNAESGHEDGAIIAPSQQTFAGGSLLPGGDQLALSWGDGSIHIWDWRARKEIRSFTPDIGAGRKISGARYVHAGDSRSVALLSYIRLIPSADGRSVEQLNQERDISLIDPVTGKTTVQLSGHTGPALAATFGPGGNSIVTAGLDKSIHFWDVATGKQIRRLDMPIEQVTGLAISPDGRWLAVVAASTRVMRAPGGGTLGISEIDKNVHVMDLTRGQDVRQLDTQAKGSPGPNLFFTPDSRFLITGSQNEDGQYVFQWDVATGKKTREFPIRGAGTPALAMSRDGQTLITADSTIRLWDWKTGQERTKPNQNPGNVSALAFLPDGRSLITAGDGITVWDTTTGRQPRRMTSPLGRVDGFALTLDGKTMAVASHAGDKRELAVIDMATGNRLREVHQPTGFAYGPVLSPDSRLLATASYDEKTIRIYDATNLTERQVVKLRFEPAGALSFSADSQTLRGVMGAIFREQIAFAVDVASGKLTQRGGLGRGIQFSAWSISPDHRLLAAGGNNVLSDESGRRIPGVIRIFDAATGKLVREFTGTQFLPNQIAYSPDGKLLATGGYESDGPVVIWDVATGKRLHEFPGHRGRVVAFAFSPDGKRLASGSIDTTVLIWDLSSIRPVQP